MTYAELLTFAEKKLAHTKTPRLDAEILLAHVLRVSRSFFYTWPNKICEDTAFQKFNALLMKRVTGIPIAYLMQQQAFWKHSFYVDERVLIPRGDTEILLETVLDYFPTHEKLSVLELGVGSGALALSLALEKPDWEIVATDISDDALVVAAENQRLLSVKNVRLIKSDWFSAFIDQRFDIIFSNPPYIVLNDAELELAVLNHEPKIALIAEEEGLANLVVISHDAKLHLKKDGILLLEHGASQAEKVRALLANAGYSDIETKQDYSGLARVSLGWMR